MNYSDEAGSNAVPPTQAFSDAARSNEAVSLQQRIGLPATYLDDLRHHVAPLAAALARRARAAGKPLLVGVNGCQGSGKSTMTQFLALMLQNGAGLRCAVLSLDDLYLTRAAREQLGAKVHPLLATRGVPGTHDLPLAHETLDALLDASRSEPFAVPLFDKATDDRAPREQWPIEQGVPDIVVLEGWCVGCPPQAPDALGNPVNALEQEEDPDGSWRAYVNEQLAGAYRALFARIDYLVLLAAPDFDCVFHWRGQQEQQLLKERRESETEVDPARALVSSEALRHFVSHFERLTRHQLAMLPALAAGVIAINADHRFTAHTGPLFR
ncbi:MAG: phosphoribulokinase [Pseudomonadota bacterium]